MALSLVHTTHSVNNCFNGKEKKGDVGMSQGPREGWGSPGGLGW